MEIEKLSLGLFSVDHLGRLSLRDGRAGGFAFQWRGRSIAVTIGGRDTDQATGAGSLSDGHRAECRILITARTGRVPSTASAAERRPDAFLLARGLGKMLPAGWRLRLLADHMLQVETEERLSMPVLVAELLLPATRFALQLAPYLDLLDERGMGMEA